MKELFKNINRLADEVAKERTRLIKEIAKRLVEQGVIVPEDESERDNGIYDSELFKEMDAIFELDFGSDEGDILEEEIYQEMVEILYSKGDK